MSKKKPKIDVAQYRMTQHINAVIGPIDYFSKVWAGDKLLWEGVADSNTTVDITDKEEVFGGLRQQGGVRGRMHFLLGASTQVLTDFLAGKIGKASGSVAPGFRGLAGIFFTEIPTDTLPGFYWQANNALLPAVEMEAVNIEDDWYPAKAAIGGTEDADLASISANSFSTQQQMVNFYNGDTGSTADFWQDYVTAWYYDHTAGYRFHASANQRLLASIISSDVIYVGSSENEQWDGSYRLTALSGDGKQRIDKYNPGYVFGIVLTTLQTAFVWRSGDPHRLFINIDEFNYSPSRIYRLTRADAESEWVIDQNFIRTASGSPFPAQWMLGFRDSDGHLVVHEESTSTDDLVILDADDFSELARWTPTGSPNTNLTSYQKCMLPGDTMAVFTNLSSNVTDAGVRTALHKFDLTTGTRTHESGWGVGTGPYSEPHVTSTGVSNGDSCWPVFMTYNRTTARLILVFRIPGEFSDTTLYYDYVWASYASDLTDYQYHGLLPCSGLRTSADARATGFGDAAFVRFGLKLGLEPNRNTNVDALKSADFDKIPLNAIVYEVSGTSFINRGGSIMIVDMSDNFATVYDWSDYDGDLDAFADPAKPSTPAVEQVVGVPSGVSGTNPVPYTTLFYDGDAKKVSGPALEQFANYTESGHRFGTQVVTDDGPLVIFDDSGEIYPLFFLGPGTRCPDHNPAHIIYDVLTDTLDGLRVPTTLIDDSAFRYAADTFWQEDLGLTILWSESADGETFIQEIIDHVEAVLYPSPSTGRLVLKPIRGDYDVSLLRRLDRSVISSLTYKRKGLGETVNQIEVTWTDPENEEEKTVTLHDPGNIAAQGNIAGDARNYHGVRSASLALQLARRELRKASYPLATIEAEVSHQFWDVVPGEVMVLNWTFRNGDTITDMAVRVIDIDRDHIETGKIQLKLSEDVFALDQAEFTAPPTGTDLVVKEEPAELAFVQFLSAPYYFAINLIEPDVAANIDEAAEETFFIQLGAQTGADTVQYDVYGEETDSLGNTSFQTFGFNDVVPRSVIPQVLPAEAETTLLAIPNPTQGPAVAVGTWVVIGDGPEADGELAIVSQITPSIVLKRGMLDTTPKEWPLNTPIWLINESADVVDNVPVAPGTYNFKLLTFTSLGTLALGDALTRSPAVVNRHYRPLRPADVQANGVAFGSVDRRGETDVDMTWAKRNRLTEDSQVLFWDDGDVTPEAGATITVQALNYAKDTVLGEDTGLTGTSHSILATKWGSERDGYVRVISETASLESYQGHDIYVFFDVVGRGAITLPLPIILGGEEDVIGQGHPQLPLPTLSATGEITKTGTGAMTLPVPTLSGSGTVT